MNKNMRITALLVVLGTATLYFDRAVAATSTEAYESFKKVKVEAVGDWPMQFRVVNQPYINAYAMWQEVDGKAIPIVSFYMGLIDIMTPDELAFVAGHEIAHHVLKHTYGANPGGGPKRELDSDLTGAILAIRSGADQCAGLSGEAKLMNATGGEMPQGKSHPSSKTRIFLFTAVCQAGTLEELEKIAPTLLETVHAMSDVDAGVKLPSVVVTSVSV